MNHTQKAKVAKRNKHNKTLSSIPNVAGKDSEALTSEVDRALKVTTEAMRDYSKSNEFDRRIHYSNMVSKDSKYYSRKDSLWNYPESLHPTKFAIYSEKNIDP